MQATAQETGLMSTLSCRKNDAGQCGNGLRNATIAYPVKVAGGIKWSQLSSYDQSTCGLEQGTGLAFCWGVGSSNVLYCKMHACC